MERYLELDSHFEKCAVLVGNTFYSIRNISDSHSNSFLFDSRQLAEIMDIGDIDVIIHSHIDTSSEPSPLDLEMMKFWANTEWWIYSIYGGKIVDRNIIK